MADAVTATLITDGPRTKVIHLTCLSDGTGEAAVTKIDISMLLCGVKPNQFAPTAITLDNIEYSISTFKSVKLYWDHTTPDTAVVLGPGMDELSFSDMGGLVDPRSAGGTGDLLLTSAGAAAGASYDIKLTFRGKV